MARPVSPPPHLRLVEDRPGSPPRIERPSSPRREPGAFDRFLPELGPIRMSPRAADIASKVITDGWRKTVAGQLSDALNDELWKSLPARKRRRHADCVRLARLANEIEAAKKDAHDAVGAIADKGLGLFSRSTTERQMARTLAKKIPLPGEKSITEVVRSLRIVGVWVCAQAGRDLLRQCTCFRALARDETGEQLEAALEKRLDELAGRAGPTTA